LNSDILVGEQQDRPVAQDTTLSSDEIALHKSLSSVREYIGQTNGEEFMSGVTVQRIARALISKSTLLAFVGFVAATAHATDWKLPAGQAYNPNAVLRVAHGGPAINLDPHLSTATGDQTYTFLVFDRLTRLDRNDNPEGMLASSWAFAPDGSYLDLTLRNDVAFHDGTKFNAQAVKTNIERAKTVARSTAAPLLAPIRSVEVIDPYKVRLHLLPGQGGTLPTILATNAGAMISPKALADPTRNLSLDPGNAGSGPYIVTRFVPNQLAVYERAPQIWDKGAGLVAKIEHTFYPTNSARLRALQTDALDFGQILGAEVIPARAMVKAGQFNAYENFGTSQALFLRASKPQLADVRVRRAIFMAIDRAAIAQAVFHGTCVPASQIFKEDSWAAAPGYVDFKFDPTAAKALLKQASATDVSFDIVAPSGSQYEQEALIVQSQLKDIGVKVSVSPMQTGDAITAFREGRADAFFYNVTAQAHPEIVFVVYFVAGYSATPDAEKPALKQLLAKAVGPTMKPEKSAELFQKATRMVGEEATVFPLCWATQLWTANPRVLNINSVPKVGTARDFRFLAVKR
jgi:peptide/nickel transport system substrate-binding protein